MADDHRSTNTTTDEATRPPTSEQRQGRSRQRRKESQKNQPTKPSESKTPKHVALLALLGPTLQRSLCGLHYCRNPSIESGQVDDDSVRVRLRVPW
jgi:hypothetical protein